MFGLTGTQAIFGMLGGAAAAAIATAVFGVAAALIAWSLFGAGLYGAQALSHRKGSAAESPTTAYRT